MANRFGVLREVIAGRPISRQEIAANTGLSLATVSTLIGELLNFGVVAETGFADSGGGRPRGLVTVNRADARLVGVDIAETYVHTELFNLGLDVIATEEEEVRPSETDPGQIVRHVVSGVRSVLSGVAAETVLGVGVSVPGQVQRESGVSVFAPNWDWHDVPLQTLLSQHLDLPLHLDNPLKASTAAELWFGAGKSRDNVVVVTLGTGVGAGIAVDGSLYRGETNSAGEWGHTTLVLGGRPCHCGANGCVETYVGAPGIMQHLRELDPRSPLLHPHDQTATIDSLAYALKIGDQVAVKTVRETARYLGAAVACLINLLNPGVVVLSGWVAARLGSPLLDEIRDVLTRHTLQRPLRAVEIELSPLASNPVSLGAATFALEAMLAAPHRLPWSRGRAHPGQGALARHTLNG
ncbi:ROK family transcriptional regulator [Actinopolymorpha sp. B9G3]|uniref:ROK family transcriptional regulator n=1 Tax=Actinopolymorpha sp. B9G3 TaxID=3158970 RepID=UPI0032D92824